MNNQETMTASILAMLSVDENDQDAVAKALGGVLVTFAEIVRGPAPVVAELGVIQEHVDSTPTLTLAELRAMRAEVAEMRRLLERKMCPGTLHTADLLDARSCSKTAPATGGTASGLPG